MPEQHVARVTTWLLVAERRRTPTRVEALRAEGNQVSCDLLYSEKAHFAAAEELQKTHTTLGTGAAVASAAAAATIFADQPIITGVFALIGAGGTAMLTFLKPDQRAERHLAAGRKLGALRVELRQLLHLDVGHIDDQQVRDHLGDVTKRKAKIDGAAPGTSERHYASAKKKIDRGDFDDDE